jgi:hypothetical protein
MWVHALGHHLSVKKFTRTVVSHKKMSIHNQKQQYQHQHQQHVELADKLDSKAAFYNAIGLAVNISVDAKF